MNTKASATPRRRQAERREEAESALLRVATRLVAERGYDGFTLADVGEAAGYSRGLPAHYFGKKDDMLVRTAAFIITKYRELIARLPKVEPGLPSIEAHIRNHGKRHGKTTRAFMMLVAESMVRPALADIMNNLAEQSLAELKWQINAGIGLGNIRPDVDVDAHAHLIYFFIRGQMSFVASNPRVETARIANEFAETIRGKLQSAA